MNITPFENVQNASLVHIQIDATEMDRYKSEYTLQQIYSSPFVKLFEELGIPVVITDNTISISVLPKIEQDESLLVNIAPTTFNDYNKIVDTIGPQFEEYGYNVKYTQNSESE